MTQEKLPHRKELCLQSERATYNYGYPSQNGSSVMEERNISLHDTLYTNIATIIQFSTILSVDPFFSCITAIALR